MPNLHDLDSTRKIHGLYGTVASREFEIATPFAWQTNPDNELDKKLKNLRRPFGLAAPLIFAATVASASPVTIHFLHVNDVDEMSPVRGLGGIAPLMTLLNEEREANSHTVFTFGGDLFSPSLLSGITEGSHMVELLNEIGTDVAVVGNHEYDFGPEVAARNFAASTFPWLGTNLEGPDGNRPAGLSSMLVLEQGGIKIGFFGLLTADTATLSSPGDDIEFLPIIETARKAVDDLKGQGAELIVAMTHLDFDEEMELAESVPEIHVILGGHDHVPVAMDHAGTAFLEAGHNAHYLGIVSVNVERSDDADQTKLAVRPEWRLVSTAGVEPDARIQKVVDRYEAQLSDELGQVIGTTSVELDSRRSSVRTRETNLGNLIAEAMRSRVDADVAIANGGGIRGDRTYDAGSTLTRGDVLAELPFRNRLVLLELSGADLLEAIENGVSRVEDRAGRFPQVAGMRFAFDPAAPSGQRVSQITVDGAPLDPSRVYRVATNDYLVNGGDGYEVFKKGKLLIDPAGAQELVTVVVDHIEEIETVTNVTDGRIHIE